MGNDRMASQNHSRQRGFTLIEIAIVMVIIGVLLGGVLKGREILVNAKLKRIVADVKSLSAAIYAYQDRYNALPGDDKSAKERFGGVKNGNGDQKIGSSKEQKYFWTHLRAAGLIAGDSKDENGMQNAFNGLVSIEADVFGVVGLQICNEKIDGKMAQIIDSQNDDGNPDSGTVRAAPKIAKKAAKSYKDGEAYVVCFTI